MGVHGSGLPALVRTKPTPQSAVIESYPQGFACDCESMTRPLGMVHCSVWNDNLKCVPLTRLPLDLFDGSVSSHLAHLSRRHSILFTRY